MVQIAVLGYGTVGSGVVYLLDKNRDIISKRINDEIQVKYILTRREYNKDKYASKIIMNIDKIVEDKDIKIVAEVIGGVTDAYEYTKKLLKAGKNVVTANKELVATKGTELFKLARENNVKYLFEASVGGGIPIIHPMIQCLVSNKIDKIVGIMNGTTNYILTKMLKDNLSFEEALKNAQKLGYAESNPAADVEGIDTCRKTSILSSLAYGRNVNPDLINVKGIDKITLEDVKVAENKGYVVKLVGYSKRVGEEKAEIIVTPCAIKKNHPLANVDDVYNAILVSGNATGEVMFYGKGAGQFPTASAVCSDIIECLDNKTNVEFVWSDEKIEIETPKLKCLDNINIPIID